MCGCYGHANLEHSVLASTIRIMHHIASHGIVHDVLMGNTSYHYDFTALDLPDIATTNVAYDVMG